VTESHPLDDPHWTRASAWLAGEFSPRSHQGLAVLGVPLCRGSITPGRSDLAPDAVRAICRRFSTYDIDHDVDLRELAVHDLGNLDIVAASAEEAFVPITRAARHALESCQAMVLLGGNNAITRPGCHAVAASIDRCGLLTLDAHLDLRDLSGGLSNGNPVRALLTDGLPGQNIVQIGMQPFANSQAYMQVAREAGITFVAMSEVRARQVEQLVTRSLADLATRVDHLYVDLDLDVLDRIFAPATPGSRPGGLTPHELQGVARICGAHPKVRAMDLVEVDPTQDVADATVMITAECLLSFASGLLSRKA
jgi:formiminoglutamase